jgi:hypothetical protein
MRWKNPLIGTERMLTSLSFLALFARERSRSSASHITHPPHTTVYIQRGSKLSLALRFRNLQALKKERREKKNPNPNLEAQELLIL